MRNLMLNLLLNRVFLVLGLFLLFTLPTNAAETQAPKPLKPSSYPYPYPYDEDPCPTGKCSRDNENPKHKVKYTLSGKKADED